MIKSLAAGLAAAILAASAPAFAQQPSAPATPQASAPATPQASAAAKAAAAEDVAAFSDARLVAMKTALKLKPDQEKAWGPFETTLRDVAKQRADRLSQAIKDRQSSNKPFDLVDAMRRRSTALTNSAGDWKRIADATEPLYKALDDNQKRRLLVLVAGAR
jgi:hypothetical protein